MLVICVMKKWLRNLFFLVADYKPTWACGLTETAALVMMFILMGLNIGLKSSRPTLAFLASIFVGFSGRRIPLTDNLDDIRAGKSSLRLRVRELARECTCGSAFVSFLRCRRERRGRVPDEQISEMAIFMFMLMLYIYMIYMDFENREQHAHLIKVSQQLLKKSA